MEYKYEYKNECMLNEVPSDIACFASAHRDPVLSRCTPVQASQRPVGEYSLQNSMHYITQHCGMPALA